MGVGGVLHASDMIQPPLLVTDGVVIASAAAVDHLAQARCFTRPRRFVPLGVIGRRRSYSSRLSSDWGDVQPNADAENDFLEAHSWDETSG